MTKDDIIRMAKECGFAFDSLGGTYTTGSLNRNLEDFANLVAAAEREACAKACEDAPEPDGTDLAERIRARSQS